jgi:hypothetical protein
VICPICKQEVVESFEVPSNTLEPFTGVDIMKSLSAWGGIDVPRTILCQDGEYTHFKFDHSGEEHLVRMTIFDQQALTDRHEYHNDHPQMCEYTEEVNGEVKQCGETGIPCYLSWSDAEPDGWYCGEHAHDAGFCPGCGLFSAGTESFDFSPTGYCENCQEEFESEFEDDDEFDDMDYFDDE